MLKKKQPGKSTVSPGGLIKKTFWFQPHEARALRQIAFDQEVSQTELVREAVRQYLGIPASEDEDAGSAGDAS